MDLAAFRASLSDQTPPAEASTALRALWWDAKGDWDAAHDCAQADGGADGALVHAYLHRKEDDQGNAGYWYRRAGRAPHRGTIDEEWQVLAAELLNR